MFAAPLVVLGLALAAGDGRDLAVLKTGVTAHVEIAGFKPGAELPDPTRTILFGGLEDGGTISILAEPNFPYIAGAECVERRSKSPRFQAFEVKGVACCEFELELAKGVKQVNFYAFPSTADFLFTVHASSTTAKSANASKTAFTRKEFSAVVASFATTGRVDAETLRLPPAVYAFRDEAAAATGDQAKWVAAQCAARADDWAPHFYLGALGFQRDDPALVMRGHERAAQLLELRAERAPKELRAMIEALDAAAWAHATKRDFKAALPLCTKLIELVPADPASELAGFRVQALYNTAACHAVANDAKHALEFLRLAVAARADFKERAWGDESFKSLRSSKEFRALVGH